MPVEMATVVPMLQARDLKETIGFYTGVLEFELGNVASAENGAPYWCTLRWGGAELMFYAASGAETEVREPGMTGVLYFRPDDVRTLWENLKEREVTVEWELQKMDYGMIEFAIRDCNGYVLSFGQEATEND